MGDSPLVSTVRGNQYYIIRIAEGVFGKPMKQVRDIALQSIDEPCLILDVSDAFGANVGGIETLMETLHRVYRWRRKPVPLVGAYAELRQWLRANNHECTFQHYNTLDEALSNTESD